MVSVILSGLSIQQDIDAITGEFAKMPALYCRRSSPQCRRSFGRCREKPSKIPIIVEMRSITIMVVCFPANQLTIIDYNRGKRPERSDSGRVLGRCGMNFTVEERGVEIYKPSGLHNFSLSAGKWYSLTARPAFTTTTTPSACWMSPSLPI